MTEPETWSPCCVLCAARGRETRLESGHCCPACRVRVDDTLQAIVRLAGEAGAWVEFQRTGSGVHTAPASRPPINLEALDPEYADARVFKGQNEPPTVTELLGMWERLIREHRGFAQPDEEQYLTGVVAFLRGNLDWCCDEPTFPLEDFVDEVNDAARPMWRWDLSAEEHEPTSAVFCPTLNDDGTSCAKRLIVHHWKPQADKGLRTPDPIHCPRCKVSRTPAQLVAAVGIDDAYVPAQIAAEHLGIAASTVREWAGQGYVQRDGSKYRYGDVRMHLATRRQRQEAG